MTKVFTILAAVAAIPGLGIPAALAQTRVFVSGIGSDANPCSLSAPCRSFQQAHNTVVDGGEIVVLDAAGYGPLTITKAVTVTAIGIEASITSNEAHQFGITINAGASDVVAIRGLTLFSGFAISDGVDINSAKSVTIRNCSIIGFPGDGILVDPSADLDVELQDVSVDTVGGDGLNILPSGPANLAILVSGSVFSGGGFGGISLNAQNATGTVTATFSVNATHNLGHGVSVTSVTGAVQPTVMITGSTLVNNSENGLNGSGNVQVLVDRTRISGNAGMGWNASDSAVVYSYKNNAVDGNGDDGLNGVVQIASE